MMTLLLQMMMVVNESMKIITILIIVIIAKFLEARGAPEERYSSTVPVGDSYFFS